MAVNCRFWFHILQIGYNIACKDYKTVTKTLDIYKRQGYTWGTQRAMLEDVPKCIKLFFLKEEQTHEKDSFGNPGRGDGDERHVRGSFRGGCRGRHRKLCGRLGRQR